VFGVALTVSGARAQKIDERTAGTTYVIGFPDTTSNTFDSRYPNRMVETVQFFIYSAVDNEVNITSPAGYINRVRPRAQKFQIVDLMSKDNKAARPIVTEEGRVNNATFRIEAKYPIIVYCYYLTRYGAEAFTPIPVESWGLEYYAFAFPGEVPRDIQPGGETDYRAWNKMGPAEILIVSAFDGTKVTITPTSKTVWWNYPSMTATLNDGECYQVQSYVDTFTANQGGLQPDIGGVYITADKPIGVVSGNSRSQLNPDEQAGLAKNSFKNMLIEWVPPTEQHGKYFVFLPTWDSRRITGQPGEKLEDKRPGEYCRVFGTMKGYRTNGTVINGGNSSNFQVGEQEAFQDRIGAPVPVAYITDTAAMAWKAPIAVTIFIGTTGYPGYLGASFQGYGVHAVEMVPREQWCRFAPYYAPVDPPQMEHFVNIVTDSTSRGKIVDEYGNRVTFNRGAIAGTDLFWGSFTVSPGSTSQWFESTDSTAKFYAFMYGFWKGYELYRPGRAKKDDDNNGSLAGGGKGDRLLHPSEYEENTAVSYGYPLAPSRIVLRPPDTLAIFDTLDCTELRVLVKAINENPVGFRSIGLDPTSIDNAKIVFINPTRASEVIGKTEAYFKVVPIDIFKNASATVVVKDRTGQIWRINYFYEAERVDMEPSAVLDFGPVTQNTCRDSVVTITNPLNKSVTIKDVSLFFRNQAFTIEQLDPSPLPLTLAKGEQLKVHLRFCPTVENQLYGDTLKATLGCTEVKLPLRGETVKPCIYVDDLNFGVFTLGPGEEAIKTMPLEICNEGRGFITFNNPSGGAVLTWLVQNFSVPQSTIDSLRDVVRLGPTECFTIYVTFRSSETGIFKTTAKFWSSTDCRRDTSVWTAIVTRPGPQITGYDWQRRWLVADPLNCTKNTDTAYPFVIHAYNTGNSNFQVAEIALVGADADAGIFKLDSSVPGQFISVGQQIPQITPTGDTVFVPQRVLFYPREERNYQCEVRLISNQGDTARNILQGIGIEPHAEITGFDYDTTEYRPGLTINGWATLTAMPTRDLTVNDIVTTDPANFRIDKTGLTFPFNMRPGDTVGVPVTFTPTGPGRMVAPIRIIGNHSACDNDSNQLVGFTYTVGYTVEATPFASILTCDEHTGVVKITNTSSVDLVIDDFALSGTYFNWVNAPALGDTIKANSYREYIVTFAPTVAGQHTATVMFELVNPASQLSAGTQTVTLSGEGRILVVNTDIANNYAAYPGTTLKIPLTLNNDLREAVITELYVSVNWHAGMMALTNLNQMTQGSLLDGWTATPTQVGPDNFNIQFTAPGTQFLTGTGNLLNMEFLTFIGDSIHTNIVQSVTAPNKPCVVINDDPGEARIDSVCGLNFRLIELTSNSYNLDQNKPNPFNPSTDITFELGLDGPTTLTIYNELGVPVAKLVDQVLSPGKYAVTWDATGFPSGLYYYRLQSGHWSKMNTMILKK